MVRRLRVDNSRDIQRNLRHIHLADDSEPGTPELREQKQLSELIQKSISSQEKEEQT